MFKLFGVVLLAVGLLVGTSVVALNQGATTFLEYCAQECNGNCPLMTQEVIDTLLYTPQDYPQFKKAMLIAKQSCPRTYYQFIK